MTFEGVVARVDLRGVIVLDADGRLAWASVRKRLQDPGARLGNAIVVGDAVTVEAPEGFDPTGPEGAHGGPAVVVAVAPRRNRFERQAAGQAAGGRLQLLAANLDQVLAVAALRDPPLREGLLDRFAVTCEHLGLPLVIAFSKADLAAPAEIEQALEVYAHAGYAGFVLSVPHRRGLDALAGALRGRRTLVMGHSGVGKSTLLNALVPALELKIGEVNARTGRGRHTTTAATLFRIEPGPPPTEVIDTPGVRTFGLPAVPPGALPGLFPEWRGRGTCRFDDCAHRDEPGCAMKAAVAAGALGEERYRSYLRLREELERAQSRRTTGREPAQEKRRVRRR